MAKTEIRCPNCGSNFLLGNGGNAVSELKDGIHYLVPETIRNENVDKATTTKARIEALKAVGIDLTKLNNLMQKDKSLKDIFAEDDPILEEIGKGGFIRNPELFRRWICAQTFRLLKDPNGWTHAVRKTYDIVYIFNQSKRELALLCKLSKKCPNDIRFQFFTLYDLKVIFSDLADRTTYITHNYNKGIVKDAIWGAASYASLYDVISNLKFNFRRNDKHIPRNWLNCFKGAGAYYTLQNIIRTHDMVLPNCKDMNESLDMVEHWFKEITGYNPSERRWDIMLSLLTNAVIQTKFELKY